RRRCRRRSGRRRRFSKVASSELVLFPLPLGEGQGEGLTLMLRRADIQPLTPALSQRERGQEHFSPRGVSIAFLAIWFIIFICCGLPLLWLVAQVALNPHVLVELRLDSFRLHLLGRTLLYNGAAAAIATAMP